MVETKIVKHLCVDDEIYVEGERVMVELSDEYKNIRPGCRYVYHGRLNGITANGFYVMDFHKRNHFISTEDVAKVTRKYRKEIEK